MSDRATMPSLLKSLGAWLMSAPLSPEAASPNDPAPSEREPDDAHWRAMVLWSM